jgi:hypothetical protein
VVQRLSDGSALRLTIARWLTPKEQLIQGIGLVPEITSDAGGGEGDLLLARAVTFVQGETTHASSSPTPPAVLAPASPAGIRTSSAPDSEPIVLLDGAEREATSGVA